MCCCWTCWSRCWYCWRAWRTSPPWSAAGVLGSKAHSKLTKSGHYAVIPPWGPACLPCPSRVRWYQESVTWAGHLAAGDYMRWYNLLKMRSHGYRWQWGNRGLRHCSYLASSLFLSVLIWYIYESHYLQHDPPHAKHHTWKYTQQYTG